MLGPKHRILKSVKKAEMGDNAGNSQHTDNKGCLSMIEISIVALCSSLKSTVSVSIVALIQDRTNEMYQAHSIFGDARGFEEGLRKAVGFRVSDRQFRFRCIYLGAVFSYGNQMAV
jgi:hypothetical protein